MAYSVFKFQLEVVTNLLLYANFYSLFIIVYCAIHLIRQLADIVSYINPKSCHTCLVSAAKMLKEVSTYAGPFHADHQFFRPELMALAAHTATKVGVTISTSAHQYHPPYS